MASKYFVLGSPKHVENSFDLPITAIDEIVGQNTGNLAFNFAIRKALGDTTTTIPWGSPPENINAISGIGVIPCANQVGPHTDMALFADTLSKVEKPIVAVGLGANGSSRLNDDPHVPQGTLNWIREMTRLAPSSHPNITVRGEYTKKILTRHGFGDNVVALGCPSLFISDDDCLGEKLQERYRGPFTRIAVAAGHPEWGPLCKIERSLVRMMEATGGDYIVQATWEVLALSRGEDSLVPQAFKDMFREYLCPDLSDSEFSAWRRRYLKSFYQIPAWIEYLKSFDLVIGARIHGVMLAIQAGVPGICIVHDSRIRELCEISKIPYVMMFDAWHDGITEEDLKRASSQFDGIGFDENRRTLRAAYQEFYRLNLLAE